MTARIHHLDGTHLTATDRRNIPLVIEELRERFAHHTDGKAFATCCEETPLWVNKRKGYKITPQGAGVYGVQVITHERNDYGKMITRRSNHRIQVLGVRCLISRFSQGPLAREESRGFRSELTEAGEQTVIPGCEKDAAPGVRQLSLF